MQINNDDSLDEKSNTDKNNCLDDKSNIDKNNCLDEKSNTDKNNCLDEKSNIDNIDPNNDCLDDKSNTENKAQLMTLKQFLFLRNDLEEFSVGALVAQGCHASVAAIERFKNQPDTQRYLKSLYDMTTVVYSIDGSQIEDICMRLTTMGVDYHLWMEERILPTCIATVPVDITENKKFNKYKKRFNLFKMTSN